MITSRRCLATLSLLLILVGERPAPLLGQGPPPMVKSRAQSFPDAYQARRLEGWEVLVNSEFHRTQPDLSEQTLKLLDAQLYQVARALPAEVLAKLRKIRIWVEESRPHPACMAYHPDEQWLREHGVDPRKARCIEIANVRNFLKWSHEQPWMLMHELAHGYHHNYIGGGFQNAAIKAAYAHAMEARLYESVLHFDSTDRRAYAANNEKEYFAELTEAYLGTNDQFPFVRAELRRHDPEGYAVVEKVWGTAPAVDRKARADRSAGNARAKRPGRT